MLAMLQMIGVFAEFESSMIQERIRAGLQLAREQGTKSGRSLGRPRVTTRTENQIRSFLVSGMGKQKTAKTLGVGVATVMRVVRADDIANAGVCA